MKIPLYLSKLGYGCCKYGTYWYPTKNNIVFSTLKFKTKISLLGFLDFHSQN